MARTESSLAVVRACGTIEEKAPLSEPVVVQSVFLTGAAVAVTDTCVRLVGFEELEAVHGEMAERRIVSRVVMSTATAREIIAALQKALTKGGH